MGGIVGKLSFSRDVQVAPATVRQMLEATAHRSAPDISTHATYFGTGVALASCGGTRACPSIVGHNEFGTVRAVADCELTNAESLREQLESSGHLIRSSSDAELIAHAYEEWGDACVRHLSGPFACAVWDDARRRLLLARDSFGMRPLAFALLHGDGVVFASQIKALIHDPAVGREWHPEAIDTYLALGCVPAPFTMYRRITKLEPAHTLVADGRRLTTRRYRPLCTHATATGAQETIDRLETCLRDSVTSLTCGANGHLLVSGGAASTAIAVMMPREASCVTVGIEPDLSTLNRVSATAAHLGLTSHIDIAAIDGVEATAFLAAHFDEPVADPAAITEYAVFAAARRYVDAALSGHGASVLWGGRRPLALFDDVSRHSLYTRRFSWQVREADPLHGFPAIDLRLWLADASLATTGQVAAATGLRLRYPFLDRRIVNFAWTLDLLGTRKLDALRQMTARHLPASLVPPARSTALDVSWLERAVRSLVPTVLLGDRFDARAIFSRTAIRALWDEHCSGRRDHARRLWAVLMLELWFREFIDGDAASLPAEYAVLVRAA